MTIAEIQAAVAARPSIADVQAAVARYFGLSPADLALDRRDPIAAHARQVAMFLAYEMTGQSFSKIGRRLRRDHSTVMYGIAQIKGGLDSGSIDAAVLDELRHTIQQRAVEAHAMLPWSEHEDRIVRDGYHKRLTIEQLMALLPGRSRGSISTRAYKLRTGEAASPVAAPARVESTKAWEDAIRASTRMLGERVIGYMRRHHPNSDVARMAA